jgi:predicted DNA-binding protein (UPF0251 family)
MSLAAVLATPTRAGRSAGRPRAADAPTAKDYLKALRLRVCHRLTEEDAAAVMGVSRKTLRSWCRKAAALPEGRQIIAGPLD